VIEITFFQAEDFLSFETLEYHIPKDSLVFVGGCVDEDLGKSNGAGKSSMWEVIPWVLYGKTVRGLNGDEVVRRGQDGVTGEVRFTIDDKKYQVQRERAKGRGKLRLIENGKEVQGVDIRDTQRILEGILGVSYDLFINSVVFGQGLSYRFVQAPDSEKKEIFEQLLDLGWLSEAHARAKGAYSSAKSLSDETARKSETLSVRIRSLEEEERWLLSSKTETADVLRSRISGLESSISTETTLAETKESEMQVLDERMDEKNNSLVLYRELRTGLLHLSQSISGEVARMVRRVSHLSVKSSEIEGLAGKPCPTCLQPIPKDYPKSLDVQFADERDILSGMVEFDGCLNNQVLGVYNVVDRDIKKVEEDISGIELARRTRKREREDALRSISEMRASIAGLTAEHESQVGRAARLETVQKSVQEALGNQMELDGEASDALQEMALAEFWMEGFGNRGVKSLVLSSVLEWVNEASRFFSVKLTNGELVPSFLSTSVKAGVEKEVLSVTIQKGPDTIDYRTLSGGEKRRVDVVVLLTLCRLMGAISGREVNLLVFDEVFESLDTTGIESVIYVLKEFAKNGKSVFVVSHQEEASSSFELGVLVHKDSLGVSRIV